MEATAEMARPENKPCDSKDDAAEAGVLVEEELPVFAVCEIPAGAAPSIENDQNR